MLDDHSNTKQHKTMKTKNSRQTLAQGFVCSSSSSFALLYRPNSSGFNRIFIIAFVRVSFFEKEGVRGESLFAIPPWNKEVAFRKAVLLWSVRSNTCPKVNMRKLAVNAVSAVFKGTSLALQSFNIFLSSFPRLEFQLPTDFQPQQLCRCTVVILHRSSSSYPPWWLSG